MLYGLLVVIVLPLSLSWMSYNPLVQTFLARMAGSYLSKQLNTVITIDGLFITPRLNLHVMNVRALDQRSDTLFHAGSIFMDMSSFRFRQERKIFNVNDIAISDAYFALIKNVNDSAFTYSFIRDHFETSDPTTKEDTIHGPTSWQVSLGAMNLTNVRFRFLDETKERKPIGMDYANLDIFINSLIMDDLHILNDTFNFAIRQLSCRDRCGFTVDELSGDFQLSPLFLYADSLKVRTPNSDLSLDLAFDYKGWPSYITFTESVDITSSISPSELNFKDIGYFAPDLLVMDNRLRIGGEVDGTVSNLKIKDFRFTYGSNTRFQGDIRLNGLPDVRETFIHTRVKEFSMTRSDIEGFAIPGTYRYIPVPDELGIFGTMSIDGSFTGFYNDFVSTADFVSDIGSISTDVSLRQDQDRMEVFYEGEIRANDFHIGKFLNLEPYFGEMDLDARISGSGLTAETVNINMSGSIDSLIFMQERFDALEISGEIAENRFNGHLDVTDELINMTFDGKLDFKQEKPIFDFTADIRDADLFNLHMLKRDSMERLSAKLTCNFIGFDPETLEGRILIDSLEYLEGEKSIFMEHLALISLKDTGYYRKIMLSSDLVNATAQGNFTIREMSAATNRMVRKEFDEWAFMHAPAQDIRPQSLTFDITLKETADFFDIFVPGLLVEPESNISGSYNSTPMKAEVNALIPQLEYWGIRWENIDMKARSKDNALALSLETDHILLKEPTKEDTLELGFEAFRLDASLDRDSLDFTIAWDDQDAAKKNTADIRGYYTYQDSTRSQLRFMHADIVVNDSVWSIGKDNSMIFGPRYFEMSNFNIKGGTQEMNLHGRVTEDPADTMRVDFSKWRLSNFDIIFRNYDFDLDGALSGTFGISNVYEMPNFFSQLKIDDLGMNKVLIGDADIRSIWNNRRESVDIDASVIYQGELEDSKVVGLKGSYFPGRKRDNMNFRLELMNLRLEAFSTFLDEYISDIKGVASGSYVIGGSVNKPTLHGELKLMRTECRVNYLNTRYSFSHSFRFNPGRILFENVIVYDSLGNKAFANGVITHSNLADFNFNLMLSANNFICLNTNRYQNQVFYGTGIVSGDVRFYGPPEDFHIDADLQTSDNSNIVIPLNNSFTVTENDFVIFRNTGEEEEEQVQEYNVDLQGLNLDFSIGINNRAELMIYLPGNMGNISSRGYGDINFTIDPRGEFRIFGDYNFLGGTFFFSLQNLINRRFQILQGGSINFSGNPYNAEVDLKALYRLKTTLSGLGASISPEFEGQRVNVNAYLGLRGILANPDIHFSIDFPNVADEVKSTIYAVLDTNDVVLMNQQMVSLLLMNNFSYASSSTNMSASSFNIISSQLSNWLSQISRDFDIGINYIAGDEMNQDELEVALSTQFFDNRLIIDGNVGVLTTGDENRTSQQQASNIVGDVNIEYKLTPDGRIRLRAFNRSNNINTLEYYAPYTQGVGIFYTKEFDRFGDLFRRQSKMKEVEE